MKLEITHRTEYSYSQSVFLEPHYCYFFPHGRANLRLNEFDLKVTPEPEGKSFQLDQEGNTSIQLWFNDFTHRLQIDTSIVVETNRFNPFGFLPAEDAEKTALLDIFLQKEHLSQEVMNWGKSFISREDIMSSLIKLNTAVNDRFDHSVRYQDTILSPNECFRSKKASCRDLSWLVIQLLRNAEVPARFVSGYAHNPDLEEGHELHAWVEAFVPGGGWIGLDPSAGLLTTMDYIPVCTSYDPKKTLPVQGAYRGSAKSKLKTFVRVEEL